MYRRISLSLHIPGTHKQLIKILKYSKIEKPHRVTYMIAGDLEETECLEFIAPHYTHTYSLSVFDDCLHVFRRVARQYDNFVRVKTVERPLLRVKCVLMGRTH